MYLGYIPRVGWDLVDRLVPAMAASSSSGAAAFDVDAVIEKLLEVRGGRPGNQVALLETDIRSLCTTAREIFLQQPVLRELKAPI